MPVPTARARSHSLLLPNNDFVCMTELKLKTIKKHTMPNYPLEAIVAAAKASGYSVSGYKKPHNQPSKAFNPDRRNRRFHGRSSFEGFRVSQSQAWLSFFRRNWQMVLMILMVSIFAFVSVNRAKRDILSAETKAAAADQARQIADEMREEAQKEAALALQAKAIAQQEKANAEAKAAAEAKSRAAAQAQAEAEANARAHAEKREQQHKDKLRTAEKEAAISEAKAAAEAERKTAAQVQAAAAETARQIAESREKEHKNKRQEAEKEAADARKAKATVEADAAAADRARQNAESREKLNSLKLDAAEKETAIAKKAKAASEAKATSEAEARAEAEKQRHYAEKKVARIIGSSWCGLSVCAYRQKAIEA